MFQQTATQWDLNTIDRYPPPDERYFILALFVVCVVATVKVVRIWLLAPPFRRALPAPPNYRKKLQLCINALAHWLWLPIFFWLFLSTHRLYALLVDFENTKTTPIWATIGDLQELAKFFSFALSAAFYVFLLRWNLLIRLIKLRD
jgi:hypothetical protein